MKRLFAKYDLEMLLSSYNLVTTVIAQFEPNGQLMKDFGIRQYAGFVYGSKSIMFSDPE